MVAAHHQLLQPCQLPHLGREGDKAVRRDVQGREAGERDEAFGERRPHRVVPQVEALHLAPGRADRRRKALGARVADEVVAQRHRVQRRVPLQRLRQGGGALVADLVVPQLQRVHRCVALECLRQHRRLLVPDAAPLHVKLCRRLCRVQLSNHPVERLQVGHVPRRPHRGAELLQHLERDFLQRLLLRCSSAITPRRRRFFP
mmetsp:Transcript_5224/g.12565  ORF Transcript_5224/g.12565 Transcript_5224/m.12565 type:complete len:202 (-) Transcript_5224:23-628(-)